VLRFLLIQINTTFSSLKSSGRYGIRLLIDYAIL
jgi:hypothetical protein